ncbi:MAG: HigA family addiction module antidote protein [Acidobacteria bacterium]|nr:HigA family addiction module antidote protein [Acidobacteriota bacterium]
MLNGRKRRPTHPGELLREEIVPATDLTQTELAERLGVSRRSISDLLNERRSLTPDMAHRLARVFKTTPEFWMNLQQAVDIWETLEINRQEYSRIRPLKAA